jgi:hypothetical protein
VMTMPTQNLGLKTQDSAPPGRQCRQCDYAARVLGGRAGEWVCANHPEHGGRLAVVAGGKVRRDAGAHCRSFRVRHEAEEVGADDAVRHIPLGAGLFAIVDAADYEWLSQYHWQAFGTSAGHYAYHPGKGRRMFMHRLIMNPSPGKVVDHINGSRHDNRRCNLRECTQAENLRNKRKYRGTSRFKGVSWDKRRRKWRAVIVHQGKAIALGFFADEVEAARAYDRAARDLFGSFAYLNFPGQGRVVLLEGHGRFCAWIRERKSQIPISKSQTKPVLSLSMDPKTEIQMTETGAPNRSLFGIVGLEHSSLFRILIFGFRIWPPVGPRGPP